MLALVEPETLDPKARLATGSCLALSPRLLTGEATYKDVVFPTPATYPDGRRLGLRVWGLCCCPKRFCATS